MKHLLLTHLSLNLHAVLTFFTAFAIFFLSVSESPEQCYIFKSVTFQRPFVSLTLCFVSLHPLLIASHGGFAAESVFAVLVHICFVVSYL